MIKKEKTKQELIDEIADLTERLEDAEKIKAAFRESEQRLTDIIDFLPDATFAIDLEGRIIAWNKAIETMTGYKADQMIGKADHEYSLPFYGSRRPILIDLVFKSDEEITSKYHFVKRDQGMLLAEADVFFEGRGERNLWGKAGPLYDSFGNVVGAIESIRDITQQRTAEKEREELERHLRRAEKMKAVGTLAGGVAHDLNNMIGVIIGYAELLIHELTKQSPLISRLKHILKSAERAAVIVQDLLTLARRGVLNRQVINLNHTVEDLLESPELSSLMTHHPHTRLHTELDPSLGNISGSSVHFSKSLFNLVSNALESMPEGGRLSISTRNEYLHAPIHGHDRFEAGPFATVRVSDTGSGIAENDIQRIFEPFYTKKVMGRSGSGLGLAVVWGTVEDHDGYIDVQSNPGQGSTFILYIPTTTEALGEHNKSIDASEYSGNGETILILDDDEDQRRMAAEILSSLNYHGVGVASGKEAVAFVKKNRTDLVVLDMIMDPGMDGLDTYSQIVNLNPGQRAIIVSGFAETDRVAKTQALGAGTYIRKPYKTEQLAMAVRKELDR